MNMKNYSDNIYHKCRLSHNVTSVGYPIFDLSKPFFGAFNVNTTQLLLFVYISLL
jgi:hypothetical protein